MRDNDKHFSNRFEEDECCETYACEVEYWNANKAANKAAYETAYEAVNKAANEHAYAND